ncbi:MAG: hypothetical protein PF569_08570 [Candidatus Woesearchaeota archaeon]|jgi:hypothetical protein|nr:hypothetical protein [Candidatus Woesearchaeota archaeon]
MKKQFCTYEIALALKELGFDEKCFGWYNPKIMVYSFDIGFISNSEKWLHEDQCAAPLWQQAIDWLDNKYNIFITLALLANGYGFYIHNNYNNTNKGDGCGIYYTLYQAREVAILKAIEIIKNKNE